MLPLNSYTFGHKTDGKLIPKKGEIGQKNGWEIITHVTLTDVGNEMFVLCFKGTRSDDNDTSSRDVSAVFTWAKISLSTILGVATFAQSFGLRTTFRGCKPII